MDIGFYGIFKGYWIDDFSSDKDRKLSKDIVLQRNIKSQATSIVQRVINVWLPNYNV